MVHQSLVLLQKQHIEGSLLWLTVQGCGTTGKALPQELEVVAHTASTFRKQTEMEAGAQLTFSILFSPWDGTGYIQDGSPLLG